MNRRTPRTKLGAALRKLAAQIEPTGRAVEAKECEYAAMNLDRAAISLGAKGERVKQLGSYGVAAGVYRKVAGESYNG